MNPEFDEVLLTAYLDDEVTEAEREAVEEQLRTSESSRKLLEELRSVRSLVMQLHQAQPSRSFQSGPWNASAIHVEPAKAVLNEPSGKWSWSYQKLASLAALIAIALCISVLIIQPNGMFISRSENTKTDSGIELQLQTAPQSTDLPLALQKVESGDPSLNSIDHEDRLRLGDNPTEKGLAKSEAAVATRRDNARAGGETAGAGQSGPGGFRAPPARAQAKTQVPTKQSEFTERIPLGDPAPAPIVTAPPRFGMPPSGTAEISSAMDLRNPMNLMAQSLRKSLLVDSPNDRDNWIEVTTLGDNDRSLARIDLKAGAAEPQNLGRALAIGSEARYSFRYRGATEKEKVADDQGMPLQNQTTDFFKQPEVDASDTPPPMPLLIELQIPREDWGAGAKRLRELGMAVPMALPSLGYVDFNATQLPIASSTAEPSDKAGAATESLGSRWQIQLVEPKEPELATGVKKTTSNSNPPPTAGGESTEVPSVFRIRVRAIQR